MAIELNTDRAATSAAANAGLAQDAGVISQGTGAAPVLSGAALKVSSGAYTDLEKLVAQLKDENANVQQSVAQHRISILLTVLKGMSDRISQHDQELLVETEKLGGENEKLEREIKELEKDRASAAAKSAVLQSQIEALEKMTDNEIENGAEHRKQIEELKRRKAEEDAKVTQCENAISSARMQIALNSGKIQSLVSSLGAVTLQEAAAAVRAAAGEIKAPENAESESDRQKAEAKEAATDPVRAIHEALDKLEADITRAIETAREIKA